MEITQITRHAVDFRFELKPSTRHPLQCASFVSNGQGHEVRQEREVRCSMRWGPTQLQRFVQSHALNIAPNRCSCVGNHHRKAPMPPVVARIAATSMFVASSSGRGCIVNSGMHGIYIITFATAISRSRLPHKPASQKHRPRPHTPVVIVYVMHPASLWEEEGSDPAASRHTEAAGCPWGRPAFACPRGCHRWWWFW